MEWQRPAKTTTKTTKIMYYVKGINLQQQYKLAATAIAAPSNTERRTRKSTTGKERNFFLQKRTSKICSVKWKKTLIGLYKRAHQNEARGHANNAGREKTKNRRRNYLEWGGGR